MKRPFNKKKILFLIIALVLIAVMVIKLQHNKQISKDKVYQYDKTQALHVVTDTIRLKHINTTRFYSGIFISNKEAKISAETQGKISRIYVEEGAYVKQGQILLQIDKVLLLEQLNIIEVQLQNAKAENSVQLNAIQIQIDELSKDVVRYSILSKADAIQGIQLEKAQMQLKISQNQKASIQLQSGIKNLVAQKKNIIEQINKTTINAPFDGVVTAKLSEEGSYAPPGIPIIQLTDIRNLKFTINVTETELKLFKTNQTYSIFADAYTDVFLFGKATMIGSKANIGSSFPVQFTVNNTSDLKIKSGMFGKVNLSNESTEMGIVIPSSAIINSNNQNQVYIVKDGKAMLHSITISKNTQNNTVVSSGLNEGDVIVISGFINLFNGANISIKN